MSFNAKIIAAGDGITLAEYESSPGRLEPKRTEWVIDRGLLLQFETKKSLKRFIRRFINEKEVIMKNARILSKLVHGLYLERTEANENGWIAIYAGQFGDERYYRLYLEPFQPESIPEYIREAAVILGDHGWHVIADYSP